MYVTVCEEHYPVDNSWDNVSVNPLVEKSAAGNGHKFCPRITCNNQCDGFVKLPVPPDPHYKDYNTYLFVETATSWGLFNTEEMSLS